MNEFGPPEHNEENYSSSVPGAAAWEPELGWAVRVRYGCRHGCPPPGAADMDACPDMKHPRLSVVKFPTLRQQLRKYCWSSKTSWASPQQHAGPSGTAKNCIGPILMGKYWDNSILISFACVKWLSDQICRSYCKFGRSATITLHTRMISECYCLAV